MFINFILAKKKKKGNKLGKVWANCNVYNIDAKINSWWTGVQLIIFGLGPTKTSTIPTNTNSEIVYLKESVALSYIIVYISKMIKLKCVQRSSPEPAQA